MRHRSLLTLLAASLLIALSASPASAALNSWTNFPQLNAAAGANWVREYVTGLPPTTIYAATEDDGVWRSLTDGLTWENFSAGLTTVPGAMSVRTVYTSGTTVFAGTTAGLFKSVGGGAFQPVAQGPEADPKHPKNLNAAVQALYSPLVGPLLAGVASGGVYRSYDSGATWMPPTPGNGMSSSETVWSLVSFVPGVIFAATGSGIYRSLDSGATWTLTSDGIGGTTLRIFKDEKAPNIYYAGGTGGVIRTINAGLTWSDANGPVGHEMLGGTVRALQQFSDSTQTRLYVASGNGVWAGTTGHGVAPGPIYWRKVTNDGLNGNTIFWALTSFTTTPGTMLAGTQSNGGYALTFSPPVNTNTAVTKPHLSGTAQVAKTLSTTDGTWTGTPTIEFEYQWQRCVAATLVCSDIPDATNKDYVAVQADKDLKLRVVVTGSNDFPSFGLSTGTSDYSAVVTAAANSIAGATTHPAPSLSSPSLPQPGDTISVTNSAWVPPADSFTYQWYRCDGNGANCDPIQGANTNSFKLSDTDVGSKLAATATGKNTNGANTSSFSGMTNLVLAPDPVQTAPTTLNGKAYVGDSLISGTGGWKYPGTSFARQWESCEPDGTSCQTISGAKAASYLVKSDDLGSRLRVRIAVDSNGPNNYPPAVEVFSPLSDVVTDPPPPPADPVPTPAPGGGGGATPQPSGGAGASGGGGGGGGGAAADKTAPTLGGLGVVTAGGALKLRSTLSEGGSLAVVLQKVVAGHKKGKKCKAGGKSGKKCTIVTKLAGYSVAAPAGAATVALPKRKLAKGVYRLVVTPVDAAGNRGAARTVGFKITKR